MYTRDEQTDAKVPPKMEIRYKNVINLIKNDLYDFGWNVSIDDLDDDEILIEG